MIALLAVFAGFCIIVGAPGFADKVLRTVAGLVVILTFLPGLLARCDSELQLDDLLTGVGHVLAVVAFVLAAIGFVAWRTRAYRARTREERFRRNGSARERALPAAPVDAANEES